MITYATISKQGNREYNEDRVYGKADRNKACFVLADGLGGQGKGDVASGFVVETIERLYQKDEKEKGEEFVNQAVATCQEGIFQLKEKENIVEDMMSTLVLLLVEKSQITWGHVGDSRLYHFEKSEITERTTDHSVPQVLVASGEITEADIRHHPDRNRLLRAIGMSGKEGKLNSVQTVKRGSECHCFLLCSDGFWEHIDEKKMEKALRFTKSPEKWLEKMEKIVLKNGKDFNMDNYSAIAVFVDGK